MIVVTGASGNLGRLVIESLRTLVPADQIVAGARSPERLSGLAANGIAVRMVDYDRPETLREALTGADKVLLISASDPTRRVGQHRAVIEAASAEGVSLLAYTSVLHAPQNSITLAAGHAATEAAITESGLPYVLLRHGWYIENYTENLAPTLAHDTVIGSAGDGRIAAATRFDYARAAAAVLTSDGHAGATYELAGTAFTLSDLAAELSRQVGRTIRYEHLDQRNHLDALLQAGMPQPDAELLVDADQGIARGDLDAPPATLESLIGRSPTTLADAIAAKLTAVDPPDGPMDLTASQLALNKQRVGDFYEAFYNHKDYGSARPMLTEGFINHHPGVPPGRDHTIEQFRLQVADNLPQFSLEIRRMAAEGDLVWVNSVIHDGQGHVLGNTVDIWQLENERLAEHWDFAATESAPQPAEAQK